MRHLPTILLAAAFLSGPAPAAGDAELPPTESAAEQARELLRAGEYELTYFGQTVGRETFRIERTPDGYQITATLRMNVGDQPSCESVYTLDSNRRLLKATYHTLEDPDLVATYTREGSALRVVARQNDVIVDEQTITIPADAIVTGPHYVTDFFVLAPLDYDIGAKRSIPAYAFGFEDWRIHEVEMKSKREKNRTVDGPDRDDIDAEIYRCWIDTEAGDFKTRSFLDDQGVSVRITIERLIGYVDIRLRNPD